MRWCELIRDIRSSCGRPIAWLMIWVELWEWCSEGLQSIVSCKFEVHQKPEATYIFRMKKQDSPTVRCTGIASAKVTRFIMTDWALHICQSHLAIGQSRWYSSIDVWVWDTACICVAERKLLPTYDRRSGAPELQAYSSTYCSYATTILTQVLNIAWTVVMPNGIGKYAVINQW